MRRRNYRDYHCKRSSSFKKFSEIRLLEKDEKLGTHSTTRNSGVIHAGFYYSPESKKAKFCSRGNKLMREYCIKNNIKTKRCGKVVVTRDQKEEEMLLELFNRGIKNGCQLEILNKEKLYEYESLALTHRNFLWSPNTWSISPFELLDCLLKECKSLNINFTTGERIISAGNDYIETSKNNKFYLITLLMHVEDTLLKLQNFLELKQTTIYCLSKGYI